VPPAPNLARRPFVNARPVRRLAAAAWIAAALLLAVNALLFWSYARSSGDTAQRLEQAIAERRSEGERIEALERELSRLDLARQNAQVGFLNRRIAERTFPWSELFDRLGEVLPRDVRITHLSRLSIAESESAVRARRQVGRNEVDDATPGEFPLSIHGVARDDESMLRFVDALFGHPSFGNPNLARESASGGGVEFDLSVTYRVAAPTP
jgi:Tfp pilus assembly protein PilN